MDYGTHVLVTTDHNKRGVFAGVLKAQRGSKVTLTGAQMAIYWSADVRGVLGLAAKGPTGGCRIGAPVPEIELAGVTSITRLSPEAVEAWKAAPWTS